MVYLAIDVTIPTSRKKKNVGGEKLSGILRLKNKVLCTVGTQPMKFIIATA